MIFGKSLSKLCITFVFNFFVIMFRLRCWFDKKIGIVFNCFTKVQIWACPNKCLQNRHSDVENSLYQFPACFLAQDFVYSIDSLGEIIFQIFKLKKELCAYEEKTCLSLYLYRTLSIKIELIGFNIISNFYISMYPVYYLSLYIQIRFQIIA